MFSTYSVSVSVSVSLSSVDQFGPDGFLIVLVFFLFVHILIILQTQQKSIMHTYSDADPLP